MKNKDISCAVIILHYYMQGDDLLDHLENAEFVSDSFMAHARQMESVTETLRNIASFIRYSGVENDLIIDAEGNNISITGPKDFIEKMVSEGFATFEGVDENFDFSVEKIWECCDDEGYDRYGFEFDE